MAIKSERLRINKANGEANQFDGTVDRVDYRGNNSKVRVKTDEGFDLEVMTGEAESYETGQDVVVSWSDSDCRIYEI